MINLNKNIFLLVFNLIVFLPVCQSQNLALNKRYELSRAPNYQNTAVSTDTTSLTDGIYTKGYFWGQRTTVGWKRLPVVITIDLGKAFPISAISFNTVRRNTQSVNFPKNIFVYSSIDGENFKYEGDVADTTINLPGPYLVQKLVLKNLHSFARYVRLSVIPNGLFLFCDEIEVLKGVAYKNQTVKLIPKDQLEQADDSLKRIEFERNNLRKSVNELRNIPSLSTNALNSNLPKIELELKKKNLSEKELSSIKQRVGFEYKLAIGNNSKYSFIINKYNPWDSLNKHYICQSVAKQDFTYQFDVPINGVQYGAFILFNNSTSSKLFSFSTTSRNTSLCNLELFQVQFVPSLNYTLVPDPLIPIEGPISIGSGNTNMFIFKISGLQKGQFVATINVISGNENKLMTITANVISIPGILNPKLNTNVWAYYTRPMIADRKAEASEDLLNHHINTVVIPPAILPNMQTKDYSKFINYLHNSKDVKNVLLFMNYRSASTRNGYKNGRFMDSEWKSKFVEWYNNMVKLVQQNGFPKSQIYLYPYDEVVGNDAKDFSRLLKWSKKAIPGIKYYATLANSEAISLILPLVDIAQIQATYAGLNNLPPHDCEIWIYSGYRPARAYSPYKYYRLKAWDAFVNDFKGIGFWNYADEGRDRKLNLLTDPLTNPTNSYSVIYDGPNKQIISSRRWEAFRLGIEDYSILQAYSNKFGLKNAKALARQVVTHPDSLDLADRTRVKMIVALTKY